MSIREEINLIENKIRTIFNKEKITKIEVNQCNELLATWKILTKYVPKREPDGYSIIDDVPEWAKEAERRKLYGDSKR
jgi:hypothetical protein